MLNKRDMKARILYHKNPKFVGKVCDIVYYDFDESIGKIVFNTYLGRPLQLLSGSVAVTFESKEEKDGLEQFIQEKIFRRVWE